MNYFNVANQLLGKQLNEMQTRYFKYLTSFSFVEFSDCRAGQSTTAALAAATAAIDGNKVLLVVDSPTSATLMSERILNLQYPNGIKCAGTEHSLGIGLGSVDIICALNSLPSSHYDRIIYDIDAKNLSRFQSSALSGIATTQLQIFAGRP